MMNSGSTIPYTLASTIADSIPVCAHPVHGREWMEAMSVGASAADVDVHAPQGASPCFPRFGRGAPLPRRQSCVPLPPCRLMERKRGRPTVSGRWMTVAVSVSRLVSSVCCRLFVLVGTDKKLPGCVLMVMLIYFSCVSLVVGALLCSFLRLALRRFTAASFSVVSHFWGVPRFLDCPRLKKTQAPTQTRTNKNQ